MCWLPLKIFLFWNTLSPFNKKRVSLLQGFFVPALAPPQYKRAPKAPRKEKETKQGPGKREGWMHRSACELEMRPIYCVVSGLAQ